MKFMLTDPSSDSIIKQLDEERIRARFTKWELLQMYFALCFYTMKFKKAGCKMPKSELLITKLNNIVNRYDNNSRQKKNGK